MASITKLQPEHLLIACLLLLKTAYYLPNKILTKVNHSPVIHFKSLFRQLIISGSILFSGNPDPLIAQSDIPKPITIGKLYLKEFDNNEEDRTLRPEQFSIGVADLPRWFWNIPASTGNTCYVIGISDPLPNDSSKAAQQAMGRGLLQVHLLNHAEISGVSDLFNSDLQNKYEELYRFQAKSELDGCYSKVDSFTTRYGEKMYLIQLHRTKKKTSLYTFVELYHSFTKVNCGWLGSSKLSCVWQSDNFSLSYECIQNDNKHEINSLINNDTIPIAGIRYEYHSSGEECKDDSTSIKLHRRGLWSGYFDALCEGLQTVASNAESKVNSIDRMHNDEKGTTDIRMLKRNIVKQTLQLSIKKISNIYNQLKIDIVISNKTS